MALLTGYHLLGVGLAGFLFVPSARIWGKRHVYIVGMLLIVGSCVWAGATGPNYPSFLAARVIQGVGLAPFEALVNASVGDMYPVHQRGKRMAASNFCVFGGAFATPVFVGVIADRLGYEWTFYLLAIFVGAMVPAVVWWVPETTYVRRERVEVDSLGNLVVVERSVDGEKEGGVQEGNGGGKKGWMGRLALFNGRKTEERYLHLLLRPFSLFLHPGILWVCCSPFSNSFILLIMVIRPVSFKAPSSALQS
jgi:MFS family permease